MKGFKHTALNLTRKEVLFFTGAYQAARLQVACGVCAHHEERRRLNSGFEVSGAAADAQKYATLNSCGAHSCHQADHSAVRVVALS